MNGYDPREHAAEVAMTIDQGRLILLELAALHRLMLRLLDGAPAGADPVPCPEFDNLLVAIHNAMGASTWTVGDLLARAQKPDFTAVQLRAGLLACCGDSPVAIGMYVPKRVPGESYVAPSGIEIRRNGRAGSARMWAVSKA